MISRLPLEELKEPSSGAMFQRVRFVRADEMRNLLGAGPQQFVVARVGYNLEWISRDQCYRFFKAEVKPHLTEGDRFYLEDFPDEYVYVASLWEQPTGQSVIVLEMHH